MDAFEYFQREVERLQRLLGPQLNEIKQIALWYEQHQKDFQPQLNKIQQFSLWYEQYQKDFQPQLNEIKQFALRYEQLQKDFQPQLNEIKRAFQEFEQVRKDFEPLLNEVKQSAKMHEQLRAILEPQLSEAKHAWLQREEERAGQALKRYPAAAEILEPLRQHYPNSVVTALATIAIQGIDATKDTALDTSQEDGSLETLTEEDVESAKSFLHSIEDRSLGDRVAELTQATKETNETCSRNTKILLQIVRRSQKDLLFKFVEIALAALPYLYSPSTSPQTNITQIQLPDITINPTVVINAHQTDHSTQENSMNNEHMGLHPAVSVEIHGEQIMVDEGIVDLVLWMNTLPGVKTYTSCEGCPEVCSDDAFVGFTCENPETLKLISDFVGSYAQAIPEGRDNYRLSFPDPQDLVRLNKEKFPTKL